MSIKGISKFDRGVWAFDFCDSVVAVSKQKYTFEEALEYAKQELIEDGDGCSLKHRDNYVRWRAGINEDFEPQVGWWIEHYDAPRSCPVWTFEIKGPDYA